MNKIEIQIIEEIKAFADYLPLITDIDPEVFEKQFHEKLNHINEMSLSIPEKRSDLMKYFYEICWKDMDKGIMQAHSRNKPFGYPGDYLIIDWIYTKKIDSGGIGKLWDEFYHRQAAPQAVRNRKDFFCATFDSLCKESPNGLSVLNLASGPCRDIAEAMSKVSHKNKELHFHCVDMDNNAIDYAKDIVNGCQSNVSFQWETGNVFRIRPSRYYDLIWSAGLFDYLNNRYAVVLLKKMWRWIKKGGKIIVGNFHHRNPTRNHMEWGGDWFLIYRDEEKFMDLFLKAGIPQNNIEITSEPLGINLFGIVRK